MGDIGKGNQTTSYPNAIDTDTTLANCSGTPCAGGDTVIAGHINNPTGAIVAIETALGITPQGTAASVAARLSILLANDGGLPRGTAFPISPANVPQLFYRTDQNTVYYYNTSSGSWVQVLSAASLSAYVPVASPITITAQHIFNPTVGEAAFVLGANATAQRIPGMTADQLWDNLNAQLRQIGAPGTTFAIPEADSVGTLRSWLQKITATQTATITLTSADLNKVQQANSVSAFSITLPAASANAWSWINVKNINTGAVTINVTADGNTNPVLNTLYDTIFLYSDGTNWHIAYWLTSSLIGRILPSMTTSPAASALPLQDGSGTLNNWATITPGNGKIPLSGSDGVLPAGWAGLIGRQVLTSGTTYTPTPGTHRIIVELIGGGGGGGGVAATGAGQAAVAGGGGGGAYARKYWTGISGTYSYVIGAAGNGGAAGINNGSAGGNTSFTGPGALTVTANGGPGGVAGNAITPPYANNSGSGAAATNGDINISGKQFNIPPIALSSVWAWGGSGGDSPLGGGGGVFSNPSSTQAGQTATSYGGGGSGAQAVASGAAQVGGNGFQGVIIVWEFS